MGAPAVPATDVPSWLGPSLDGPGPCPVAHTLSVVEGRWTTLVVRELLGGTRRFTQLRDGLGPVSAKVLADRLRVMEDQGLVTRQAYAEMPPRVEYSLTERGRSLEPLLRAMYDWGRTDLGA